MTARFPLRPQLLVGAENLDEATIRTDVLAPSDFAGAILAVFISLSLALGALVVNEILRLNTIAWQEGVHVIAFLNDEGESGVPQGAHNELLAEIQTWEQVEGASYWDKTMAWAEYQEIFAGQEELLAIDPTILPASIRIELTDIELHSSVRFLLEQRTGTVRQVATAAESIEQLDRVVVTVPHGFARPSNGDVEPGQQGHEHQRHSENPI